MSFARRVSVGLHVNSSLEHVFGENTPSSSLPPQSCVIAAILVMDPSLEFYFYFSPCAAIMGKVVFCTVFEKIARLRVILRASKSNIEIAAKKQRSNQKRSLRKKIWFLVEKNTFPQQIQCLNDYGRQHFELFSDKLHYVLLLISEINCWT